MSATFRNEGYLLTAAVAAAVNKIDEGYDVPAIGQYLITFQIFNRITLNVFKVNHIQGFGHGKHYDVRYSWILGKIYWI